MSTQLQIVQQQTLTVWECPENLKQIKQLFAPKLTDLEFKAYCEMGKATKLNPFLREIWSIKYDGNAPAQIFIGRDGYRKSAQAHPLYDYHQVESIYSNDKFSVKNGHIEHEYGISDRGNLLGAYCLVKRKGSTEPTHTIVMLKEYSTGKSLWNAKPETMIKKVAEAQGLRAAFQELFAGTYHEAEEISEEKKKLSPIMVNDHVNDLINKKDIVEEHTPEIYDIPIAPVDDGTVISDSTFELVTKLIAEKQLDQERIEKIYKHYKVEYLMEMTEFQAQDCITHLSKVVIE